MSETCSAHVDQAASHQCDGCQRYLCAQCIQQSHSLLLCTFCGERALPLGSAAPATVRQHRDQSQREASANYRIRDAWLYPFRGSGLFMLVAAFVSLLIVGFIRRFGIGCIGFVLWLGWLTLIAGVQFKIVKTTAKGDNELPDWPEYFSFGERLVEFLTWLVIGLLHYGPLAAFLALFGARGIFTADPSIFFWVGAAACMWLGTALSMMGFGAAGVHWRHLSLRVDLHVRGLLATGSDALLVTNCSFMMFALVFVMQAVLSGAIPILGSMIAAAIGLYWVFVEPHLAGLLFRRHAATLEAIYEP